MALSLPKVFRTKVIDNAVSLMLQYCHPDDFDNFVNWRNRCQVTDDVQEVGNRLLGVLASTKTRRSTTIGHPKRATIR
jgi:hypothetical protein